MGETRCKSLLWLEICGLELPIAAAALTVVLRLEQCFVFSKRPVLGGPQPLVSFLR